MGRERQRANARKKDREIRMGLRPANQKEKKEEKLDLTDIFGIKDPTPYQAVKNIIRRGA